MLYPIELGVQENLSSDHYTGYRQILKPLAAPRLRPKRRPPIIGVVKLNKVPKRHSTARLVRVCPEGRRTTLTLATWNRAPVCALPHPSQLRRRYVCEIPHVLPSAGNQNWFDSHVSTRAGGQFLSRPKIIVGDSASGARPSRSRSAIGGFVGPTHSFRRIGTRRRLKARRLGSGRCRFTMRPNWPTVLTYIMASAADNRMPPSPSRLDRR